MKSPLFIRMLEDNVHGLVYARKTKNRATIPQAWRDLGYYAGGVLLAIGLSFTVFSTLVPMIGALCIFYFAGYVAYRADIRQSHQYALLSHGTIWGFIAGLFSLLGSDIFSKVVAVCTMLVILVVVSLYFYWKHNRKVLVD